MDEKYVLDSYINGIVYQYTLHNCASEIVKLNHEIFDKFKPSEMNESHFIRGFVFRDLQSGHMYKWTMEPITNGLKMIIEDSTCNMRILNVTISGIRESLTLEIGIDSTNPEISEILKEYKKGLEKIISLVGHGQKCLRSKDDSGTTLAEHVIHEIDELISYKRFEDYIGGPK